MFFSVVVKQQLPAHSGEIILLQHRAVLLRQYGFFCTLFAVVYFCYVISIRIDSLFYSLSIIGI